MHLLWLYYVLLICYSSLSFENFKYIVKTKIRKDNKTDKWWFNPDIHNFGNIGIGGEIHANLATFATKFIDRKAYKNKNVRYEIMKELFKLNKINNINIALDIGCGVGISTESLYNCLKDNNTIIYAIDSSPNMLKVARKNIVNNNIIFIEKNIVEPIPVGLHGTIDFISIMFLCHESPTNGHHDLLTRSHELLKENGYILIIDIDENYNPSPSMLLGEPYLIEYQKTFRNTLKYFINNNYFTVVDNNLLKPWIKDHVTYTLLQKNTIK